MGERIYAGSPARSVEDVSEAAEAPPASVDVDALKDDIDALLDQVDLVLERNAEEFANLYVQRGGE